MEMPSQEEQVQGMLQHAEYDSYPTSTLETLSNTMFLADNARRLISPCQLWNN